MKKLILGFLIILGANAFAQQKGISYQAVIINPSETPIPGYNFKAPLANKSICLSFQILNAASQSEYQESQTTTTDAFGMVNLVIGMGNKIGGTAASFNAVTWSLGSKTLVVSINTEGTCSNYTEISRQALNYVPYAMYAEESNIKDGTITDAKVATGISKSKVGLGNVDNTSDANKIVSIAAQAALDLKENTANKSATITLGTSDALFPTQNAVKTYVDGKVAAATIADATATIKGKIQLTGDLGGTAASPTVPGLANKANISSLSTVATSGSYNDLSNKPTIPAAYNLPTSSASVLGGVKVGTNLSIDANGILNAAASGNYNDLSNKPTIPAAYNLPTSSASVLGGVKIGTNLSIDANGILSAAASGNYSDLTNKPTAYSLPTASASALGGVKVGTNLSIDANGILSAAASGNYNDLTNKPTIPAAYSLPSASASALGGIKVGSNLSIDANGSLSATATGNYADLTNKPTIPAAYSLPTASASALGGVKVGSNLSIDANGVLSAAATPADASTTAKGIIKLAGDLGGTGSTADAPIISDGAITTAKLSATGVTANSYGSATAIPVITVDAKGRITSATTTNISASLTEITDEFLSVTAAQTSFTLAQTPATGTKVKMIINGVVIKGSAHSLSGAVITYNPANNGGYNIALGDEVVFYYFVK